MFAEFEFYFTQLDGPDDPPHTYRIEAFVPLSMRKELPVTRTFRTKADGKPIAPPEPRFLALRRALAHVLYLSSAGQYIDELLEKLKEKPTKENGSTELGLFAQLRLDGWCSSTGTAAATTIAADIDAADATTADAAEANAATTSDAAAATERE